MNDFEKRFRALDKQKIVTFLISLEKPCYESELLRVAFNNKDVMDTDALTLYQNHFLFPVQLFVLFSYIQWKHP